MTTTIQGMQERIERRAQLDLNKAIHIFDSEVGQAVNKLIMNPLSYCHLTQSPADNLLKQLTLRGCEQEWPDSLLKQRIEKISKEVIDSMDTVQRLLKVNEL